MYNEDILGQVAEVYDNLSPSTQTALANEFTTINNVVTAVKASTKDNPTKSIVEGYFEVKQVSEQANIVSEGVDLSGVLTNIHDIAVGLYGKNLTDLDDNAYNAWKTP